jgi:chromosome segregation ATPase
LKNAQILSSKEIDDWFSSSQVLEAKKIELDIESHFINEARSRVSDSIQHSVEDDRNEKEILCKKKDVLTKELDHLLDLVKQKEMEIDENDTRIKAVDERIAVVVSDFKEIQSSINAKFDDLQSRLSQMHLQSEALSTKRKEIDRFLTEEEERGAKLRELVRVSKDEAKVYQEVVVLRKSLKSSILKSREEKLRLAKTEEELTLDVQMLQQEVSAARGSLQVGFTLQMFHVFLFLSSKNTCKQVDLFIYFFIL